MKIPARYSVIAAVLAASLGLLAGCASGPRPASSSVARVIGTTTIKGVEVAVIANPRINRSTPPVYPPEAQRRGLAGTGVVRVVVDQTGEVIDAVIVSSTPTADFGRAALAAARQWKYFPMTAEDGRPILYAVEIPVKFAVDQSPRPRPGRPDNPDAVGASGMNP